MTVQARSRGERFEDPLTGNWLHKPGETVGVPVFAWAVIRSAEETATDGARWIDERLQVIAPPESFTPETVLILPDGSEWGLDGNPEDPNHNPWWSPGLAIFYAQRK